MKKISLTVILASTLILGACQSNKKTFSASQAEQLPMLTSLPLLTVTNIQNKGNGYHATLTDEDQTTFRAEINKTDLSDDYVTLRKGDRVKIIGDYAEYDPIEIIPSKIVYIRK